MPAPQGSDDHDDATGTGRVTVADTHSDDHRSVSGRGRRAGRVLVIGAIVVFAVFWIWALFFASKEAVNKIGDGAWAARAQARCEQAAQERIALADPRRVDVDDPAMLRERADIVDQATDTLVRMLDDLVADVPADAKGRAIVPDWVADYRRYVEDRREYAGELRAGDNVPFRETAVDGIPISERIETFAGDNEMPACAPPHDLSI
jgi:hypothetical protein